MADSAYQPPSPSPVEHINILYTYAISQERLRQIRAGELTATSPGYGQRKAARRQTSSLKPKRLTTEDMEKFEIDKQAGFIQSLTRINFDEFTDAIYHLIHNPEYYQTLEKAFADFRLLFNDTRFTRAFPTRKMIDFITDIKEAERILRTYKDKEKHATASKKDIVAEPTPKSPTRALEQFAMPTKQGDLFPETFEPEKDDELVIAAE